MIALLRSPHFVFRHENQPIGRRAIATLDAALSEMRYLGGLERLKDASFANRSFPAQQARDLIEAEAEIPRLWMWRGPQRSRWHRC